MGLIPSEDSEKAIDILEEIIESIHAVADVASSLIQSLPGSIGGLAGKAWYIVDELEDAKHRANTIKHDITAMTADRGE